jgi:spore coat protein SA
MQTAFATANVNPPPIEVFHNFVDVDEYDPNALAPAHLAQLRKELNLDGGPVLLFVGRMIEQKGPHLALRAFQRVLSSHPKANMLFIGAPWYARPNESPFVESLRSEAALIPDRVQFMGYVDHAQMPGYYALADVVCAPSIWDDPSPFVTYEAQAMARPVLASQRGGIPEIVEDHVTGRCIDVFNTPLFTQILDDWFSSSEVVRKIGEAGRLRIQERFELRKAQRKMATIYHSMC